MSATSDPRPGEGWFSDAYQRMALIGMAMSAPCLVLGITQAMLHQDGRLLGARHRSGAGQRPADLRGDRRDADAARRDRRDEPLADPDERPRRRRVRREDGAAARELARHERVRDLPDRGDLRRLCARAVDRAARARRADLRAARVLPADGGDDDLARRSRWHPPTRAAARLRDPLEARDRRRRLDGRRRSDASPARQTGSRACSSAPR